MSAPETLRRTTAEIHETVEALVDEWDELAERARSSPFCRPGWIAAWWRSFGEGALEIIAIRQGGRLVAVLPLRRRFGELFSTTNWHTPEFAAVAEDPSAVRRLARELFAAPPRRISLAFVDAAEPGLAEVAEAALAVGCRVLTRTLERSPYLPIEGDWERYEGALSRNVRGDVRRRIRRLHEAGSVTTDVEDGRTRLDGLLAEGFRVEAASWKGARGTAIASSNETERFYREVAAWAAPLGWLRLAFLRLDGRAIAFHYSLEHDGVHYFVKGGHDESFEAFSPGKVLTYEMLRRAFASGLRSYEFLGGDDAWKRLWTSTSRERMLFQAFGNSVPASIEWAAQRYGVPAARHLARRWLKPLRQTPSPAGPKAHRT